MDKHLVRVDSIVEAIAPYRSLLEQFVRGEITPLEMETRYLQVKREWIEWMTRSDDVLEVTQQFYYAIDDYVDESVRVWRKEGDLGPEELRAAAIALLAEADLEAAGKRPKVPDKPWVVDDPVEYLKRLVQEDLDDNRPVGLFEFHTHHLGPFDDRPWAEKRAVFVAVADAIVGSGAARLTWDRFEDHRFSRDAGQVSLDDDVAWRWPWQAGDPQDVEFLTLTPPGMPSSAT